MAWLTGGTSFTLLSGSASGTAAQDFQNTDIVNALRNGWTQLPPSQWPALSNVPDFAVPNNTVGALNSYKLYQANLPLIKASSGTAGTAGAITAMTAGPTGFWNGPCYLYLPANVWNSNTAGWYYTVLSSTTAGTANNNQYSSGQVFIPGSAALVPFSGAGGTLTGVTTAVVAHSFTIPANSMGANGQLCFDFLLGYNGTVNSKTVTIKIGSTTIFSNVNTSATQLSYQGQVLWSNQGATGAQAISSVGATGASATAQTFSALDTTTNLTCTVNITNATATDWTSVDCFSCICTPG